jgi:hypothetical protein
LDAGEVVESLRIDKVQRLVQEADVVRIAVVLRSEGARHDGGRGERDRCQRVPDDAF